MLGSDRRYLSLKDPNPIPKLTIFPSIPCLVSGRRSEPIIIAVNYEPKTEFPRWTLTMFIKFFFIAKAPWYFATFYENPLGSHWDFYLRTDKETVYSYRITYSLFPQSCCCCCCWWWWWLGAIGLRQLFSHASWSDASDAITAAVSTTGFRHWCATFYVL